MFDLDFRSRKPIYEQLVDRFKELIISEVLGPDEKIPSVRALAQQLTINPNTIQKAYRELERQGFVYSIKGKGNFVQPLSEKVNEEEIENVKALLKKKIKEALFLGVTKEELYTLIQECGGGDEGD
ncbi:GntR family transcriptional regulator [Bacillus sp. FJAT-47783]|uniref:GntR family transcriptional regulator n=1 Tax=Bacillus sp. FJAT-47783 TaxID=2922712 RepID=UPI001FABB38B|nr:GntR family transcriptional regulator [Bacillus sp. FJAT-47783]